MKSLPWFDKILFFINSVFATALLFSYLLPYIPPSSFALLSVLSLAVPLFVFINMLFLVYWLLRLKKHVLLPFLVLLIGYNHVTSLYGFSTEEPRPDENDIVKVLSYNVKQFNQFKWTDQVDIGQKISDYISTEDPHVLTFQEYFRGELDIAEQFEHKFVQLKDNRDEFGVAIFSKYPIIDSGSLDFPTRSNNNGIYADVVFPNDTIRVINVHFQSFSLKPELEKLETEYSKRVYRGMGETFVRQEEQMQLVVEVMKNSPYRVLLMGDFNNTAFSYIYRELRSYNLQDAYKEEGSGFGRTYDFDYFPLRIDYILPDENIEILSFETKELPYSDHFPITAELKL